MHGKSPKPRALALQGSVELSSIQQQDTPPPTPPLHYCITLPSAAIRRHPLHHIDLPHDTIRYSTDMFTVPEQTDEQKERMLRGELYHAFSPVLTAERSRCAQACHNFNTNAASVSRVERINLFHAYVLYSALHLHLSPSVPVPLNCH